MAETESQALPRVPDLTAEEERAVDAARVPAIDSGVREANQLSRGLSAEEIEREQENSEHLRSESFRNHFERIAIASLWIVAGLLAAGLVTWFWHLLAPTRLHWLEPERLDRVQNIVTGAVLIGVISNHIKRRIG